VSKSGAFVRTSSLTAGAELSLGPEHNLSHVASDLPRASVRCVLRHYGASLLIYGVVMLILLLNPWFSSLLQVSVGPFEGRHFYLLYFAAYVVLSPVIYLLWRPRSLWNSKNVMIVGWMGRLVRHVFRRGQKRLPGAWRPTFKEKHAFMFLLIKLVYGPLMLNGLLVEWPNYPPLVFQYQYAPTWLGRLDALYGLFVITVFVLDSGLFCFGYHTEAGFLKNEVRYVETTFAGILVCIICYPPFNGVTSAFLGPSHDDMHILFRGELYHPLTWVLRGLAVLSLLLLTAASFSLFTKASNLTNRGIVQYGPYRWVRHPGYVAKNLFWLITLLPVFVAVDVSNPLFPWKDHLLHSLGRLCGFAGWCAIYVLRALTEERLLMQDPDYVAYCKKVKYRFIPGVV
jgi:protein-S-isoprenylcysteine O-methyltransferase Ste14